MTTHTPGPWRYKIAPNGDCGITAYDTGYFAEAFADIRRAGENARDEAQANARLIAAAPDMSAALQEFVDADFSRLDELARVTLNNWKGLFAGILAKAGGRS